MAVIVITREAPTATFIHHQPERQECERGGDKPTSTNAGVMSATRSASSASGCVLSRPAAIAAMAGIAVPECCRGPVSTSGPTGMHLKCS
jgi:hypothetical protein